MEKRAVMYVCMIQVALTMMSTEWTVIWAKGRGL